MQRHEISHLAHRHHPVMAPLSDGSVNRLLERLDPVEGGRVIDLGCGGAAWLRALLVNRDDLTGVGVDLHPQGDPAELSAATGGRAGLVAADVTTWDDGAFDAVVAVGVSHAFGGPGRTLDAVRGHLRPGGRVLLGDGIWDAPPPPSALRALDARPDEFPDLAALVAVVRDHGFEPVHGHVSTLEEWDEYEWSWTGSLTDWALEPGRDPADGSTRSPRRSSTATGGSGDTAACWASPPSCSWTPGPRHRPERVAGALTRPGRGAPPRARGRRASPGPPGRGRRRGPAPRRPRSRRSARRSRSSARRS